MYAEENRILTLTPEWNAEFLFRYEVKMGANGWGLVLHGPDGKKIDKFQNFISYCEDPVQDTDEELMRCLAISGCGRRLTIKTLYEGEWVVNLATGSLQKLRPTKEEIRQSIAFEEAYIQSHGSACENESKDLPNPGNNAAEESAHSSNKRSPGFVALLILVGIYLLAKLLWTVLHAM